MIYFLLQENGYEVPLICWIFAEIVPFALFVIYVSVEIIREISWWNMHKRKIIRNAKRTQKGRFM